MLERSTYYILDAQGNQLSMYDHKVTDNAVVYYLADRNIYGSSRLGSLRDTVNMFIPTNLPSYGVVGNRNYELSNHLGNVLAVVNDIVYPISDDSTTILSYEVGLTMVSDYSPFGVQLDGRTIQNEMYSPVSSDTSSQTTPIIAEIYKNEFDSPPATTSPYTGSTTTLDGNLSNTVWTSSTGDFTNYNSTGAGSGKSIAIMNASPDTSYVTLSLDVDNGYLLDITSYSFAHRSSTTGYDSYKLVVNGIEIGTGSIYVASSGSTLQSTGVVNVSNVVSGVTGTVNVVLKLYGGLHGSTGTFRMDDFILNGYTQEENAGNGSGNGYVVMGGYRYGFQGQEMDDEVKGKGNSVNYKYRMHDPRVGRFFAIDPLASKYPYYSPYQFSSNSVIVAIELEGLESSILLNYSERWIEITRDKHNRLSISREDYSLIPKGSKRYSGADSYGYTNLNPPNWQTDVWVEDFHTSGAFKGQGEWARVYFPREGKIKPIISNSPFLFKYQSNENSQGFNKNSEKNKQFSQGALHELDKAVDKGVESVLNSNTENEIIEINVNYNPKVISEIGR